MARRHCTRQQKRSWRDGKYLEMGSSDEMSDDDQLQWPEEFDNLDDPDEPIMEGSDDEFSDLGEVEEDEHGDTPFPTASSPCSSEVYTSPSSITSPSTIPSTTSHPVVTCHNTHMPTNTNNCSSWSPLLNPVTIKPFTSQVGPTIPISAPPLEMFQASLQTGWKT